MGPCPFSADPGMEVQGGGHARSEPGEHSVHLGIRPGRSEAPSGWSLGSLFELTAASALPRAEPNTTTKGESR